MTPLPSLLASPPIPLGPATLRIEMTIARIGCLGLTTVAIELLLTAALHIRRAIARQSRQGAAS